MLISFLAVLAAALLAAALLGWAAYSQRFGWAALGAVVGIALVLTITCVFWQQAVLVAAISSVVFLGLGVMLQKVEPARALAGAVAAMILFFIFTWIAVELSDAIFFGKETVTHRWLRGEHDFSLRGIGFFRFDNPTQLAFGIACIATAVFLRGTGKAIVIFAGVLLLALQIPKFFVDAGTRFEFSSLFHDPLLRLLAILLLVAFLFRMFALSITSEDQRKSGTEARKRALDGRKKDP